MELTLEELQILAGILEAKIYKEYQATSMATPSPENDSRQDRIAKLGVIHAKILTQARSLL
jgi:hypothetical protein